MATLPYSGGSRTNIPLPHQGSGPVPPTATQVPAKASTAKASTAKAPAKKAPAKKATSSTATASTASPTNAPPPPAKAVEQQEEEFDRDSYSRSRAKASTARPLSVSGDVTGFMLGLIFWGWVALPFLRGGTGGVKDTWRAKFLNKGPDGKWLP
jgi:hypothetical protein